MAPLAEANARQHNTIERQSEQLVGQAETIGRQGAELERAASTATALDDALTAHRRRVRAVAIIAAVLVALGLVVAAVAATGWLR